VIDALSADPEVHLVAMADLFEDQLQRSLHTLSAGASDDSIRRRCQVAESGRFVGFDAYRQLLSSDVDAVILGTPAGFRPLHFDAAIKAGKHVFAEKPIAVDAPGVRSILNADALARQKHLVAAVGFQDRHNSCCLATMEKIRGGAVGEIQRMEACWRSQGLWVRSRQPAQTEMEYQIRNWLYFVWLSGDIIVEQLTHLLNICNWAKDAAPVRATGRGGRQQRQGPDHGEIFDHFEVNYTYEDGTTLAAEVSLAAENESKIALIIHGEHGVAEPLKGTIAGKNSWTFGGTRDNPYRVQHRSFFAAIRQGVEFNEVVPAAATTMTAIMGRMAAYSAHEVTMDEAVNSRETFAPRTYAFRDDAPPTLPDKFGDYVVPARGRTA
jgi:predicted dehydrogenase